MMRTISAFLLLLSGAASAQVPGPSGLRASKSIVDSLIGQQARRHHFSGYAYAVVTADSILYTGTWGTANHEKAIAVSPRTRFRIASMTKSFTALAILKLRDEGKLRLDDPASKYIRELGSLKPLTSDAPPITIRHLLTHSAGFPEDNPWGDRQLEDSDAELLALASKASLSNAPGIAYEYSNLGYALLGRIITTVSGTPYQQYISTKILAPLGMTHTTWEYSSLPASELALGYRYNGSTWSAQPLLHDGAYGAMGGLITSLEDFAAYMKLQLQAWPARNGAESGPVRRSTVRELQQPQFFNGTNLSYRYPDRSCVTTGAYAFGLRWVTDCDGKVFVGHSGGLPGFGSNWLILPDYGIGIVSFANETYAPMGSINQVILDSIVRQYRLEKRTIPVSAVLQQRKEELLSFLPDWNGAATSSLFAENFFPDNSIEEWRATTRATWKKLGGVQSVGPLRAQNNLRGTFLVRGKEADAEVFFTLTPEASPKIQELKITERKH